jgi:uncharacterized damage-inducible protein DinB
MYRLLAALLGIAFASSAQPAAGRIAMLTADWERAKLGTQEYLDAMPEEGIGFKPTPAIRSFAEQMLHIADTNYIFGSIAGALPKPAALRGRDPEKVEVWKQSKAALRQAVLDSYDFMIASIKGLDPSQLDENVEFFKTKIPRAVLLSKGLEHHAHHRGQTTIYLRLKGVTPPSERLF